MDTLFDTHAHLDSSSFDSDREQVIERARAAGVRFIVTIGSGFGIECAGRAIAISKSQEDLWATVGVHPHDAAKVGDADLARIRELAASDKVVAIGEIGLDYAKEYSPRPAQMDRFRQQLSMARELNLPAVIHDRDAHEDVLRVFKEDGLPEAGGIMHCFSGSAEMAEELTALGFYISFPGVLTFKNAKKLPAVAARVQEDRILIETDCPFLAPEPWRGKRNEPAYVKSVAETLAGIRGQTIEHIAALTTANAFRAFGIIPPD